MSFFSRLVEGNFGRIADELAGHYRNRVAFRDLIDHYHVEFTEQQFDSLKYNEDQNYYAQNAAMFTGEGLVSNYTYLACMIIYVRHGNKYISRPFDSYQENRDEFRFLLFKRGVNQDDLDGLLLSETDKQELKENHQQMQEMMYSNRRVIG